MVELSFCLHFPRWMQTKAVCLHVYSANELCSELCLCIDEILFSNVQLPLLRENRFLIITGRYLQDKYFYPILRPDFY